jgi:hypothetical protein
MADLRAEATAVLRPLADLATPVGPGATPPWDQLLRVGEHQVDVAADCRARLAYEPPFDGWRAAFARRRIGRAVLERMRRGDPGDPGSIAGEVVDDAARACRDSLGRWLTTLDAGGRAAVVRDATTYAAAARRALLTWPPSPDTRFDNPPVTYSWDLPGRAVRLEAAADGFTRSARTLLLFATSTRDEAARRRSIAWLALVATLAGGSPPRTVTRIDLGSGDRLTVPVTDDVLDLGLTSAALAVDGVVAAALTAGAEPAPGPWCGACPGRSACRPGGSWLMAHPDYFDRFL